jgi:hypothetical protein
MFLTVLLGALTVWLVSWPFWLWDERLLLSSWFIAIVVSVVRSRVRHERGVGRAALAGASATFASYIVYYLTTRLNIVYGSWPDSQLGTNAVAAILGGSALGAMVAAVVTYRLVSARTDFAGDW